MSCCIRKCGTKARRLDTHTHTHKQISHTFHSDQGSYYTDRRYSSLCSMRSLLLINLKYSSASQCQMSAQLYKVSKKYICLTWAHYGMHFPRELIILPNCFSHNSLQPSTPMSDKFNKTNKLMPYFYL